MLEEGFKPSQFISSSSYDKKKCYVWSIWELLHPDKI